MFYCFAVVVVYKIAVSKWSARNTEIQRNEQAEFTGFILGMIPDTNSGYSRPFMKKINAVNGGSTLKIKK